MKDRIVKEFFWFIIGSLASLLLSFLFISLLALTSSTKEMNEIEKLFTIQLYIIGCFVSLFSIYIVRILISALKKYL